MQTTPDQLHEWLNAPEDEHLEFKEAKQKYALDDLLKYCVAIANEGGGKIILGVTGRRRRSIVGTQAFPEPGETEATIYGKLRQKVRIEEVETAAGRVLVVHVPSRLPGTAWQIDGRYLKRAGDSVVPLTDVELRAILAQVGPDFTAEGCPGASLSDLSSDAIADFRARWAKRSNDSRRHGWSDQQTLADAELIVDGRLTYAALILFGTHAALGRWLAQAEVVFEYRSSEASGPAADRVELREAFFLYHDRLWDKISLRNDRQSYQDGLFRYDLLTFDEASVREALLNAVAHRDYRHGGSVFVRQYAHRLEVVSPGGFPPGITQENILHSQNPRNRRLAEALARCGLIERSGQGVNLMFESAVRQGKALPDYSGTSDHEVRLVLNGVVRSPGFVRFMERLGDEKLRSFSTDDFLILDLLHREQVVPEGLRRRLADLVHIGAVESVGRGRGTRYILSRSLYAYVGGKGTYTRRRGLDRDANKALLLKHLRDQGQEGAAISELCQVLPGESRSMVGRLLSELRDEGAVALRGKRRWARWYVAEDEAFNPLDACIGGA